LFESLQQAKGIRGGSSEPGEHLSVVKLANLSRVGLHHNVAESNLTVPANSSSGRSTDC
jgi:hypothetical protein